jgi:hypothetical protein
VAADAAPTDCATAPWLGSDALGSRDGLLDHDLATEPSLSERQPSQLGDEVRRAGVLHSACWSPSHRLRPSTALLRDDEAMIVSLR